MRPPDDPVRPPGHSPPKRRIKPSPLVDRFGGISGSGSNYFRTALLSSNIGVAVTDTQGLFVSANPAFCRLTGYSERELRSRTWVSLTYTEDLPRNQRLARQMYRGQVDNFVLEKRYVTKTGSLIWVRNSTSVIRDRRGKPCNFIAIVEDITERKRGEQALKELSIDLMRAEDRGRRQLARDLHDSVGQNLSALVMTLGALKKMPAVRQPKARDIMRIGLRLAKQSLAEVRTVSYLLHPPTLDEFGLRVALETYVRGFTQRSGIPVQVRISKHLPRLSPEMEVAFFRVVQESLSNVRRHSGSRTAKITLKVQARSAVLHVQDFGRGICLARGKGAEPERLGVGIRGMRERLQQLAGELRLLPTKGGTVVSAMLPLPANYEDLVHSRGG